MNEEDTNNSLLQKYFAQQKSIRTKYKTDPGELLTNALITYLGKDVYNRCISTIVQPLVEQTARSTKDYYEHVDKNRVIIVIKDDEDIPQSPIFNSENRPPQASPETDTNAHVDAQKLNTKESLESEPTVTPQKPLRKFPPGHRFKPTITIIPLASVEPKAASKAAAKRKEAPSNEPRRSKRNKTDDAIDEAVALALADQEGAQSETTEAADVEETENDDTVEKKLNTNTMSTAELLVYLENRMFQDAQVSRAIDDYVFDEDMYTRDLTQLNEEELSKYATEIEDKQVMINHLSISNVYVAGGVYSAMYEAYLSNLPKYSMEPKAVGKKDAASKHVSNKCNISERKLKYYMDFYTLMVEFPGFRQCQCRPSLLWHNAVKIKKYLRKQGGRDASWWKKPVLTVESQE
jgi:hypothetical protein